MADEEKKPAHERRYAKGKHEEKGEKREEKETKAEAKSEGDGEAKANPHHEAHAAMVKRHLKEARDLHGQHRDAMKDMHGRHEAEMKEMSENMGPANGDQDQLGQAVQQPGEGEAEAE